MGSVLVIALLATAIIVPPAWAAPPGNDLDSCVSYIASQDYERAIASGRLAVKSSPENAEAYFCLGSALVDKGEYGKAIVELTKAESLADEPGMLAAIASFLGASYSHLGNREEALRQHNRALKLRIETEDKVGVAQELNDLAIEFQYLGYVEKALEFYQKSLELVPDATTYVNVGSLYSKVGKYPEAKRYMLKGLELHQRDGDYHSQAIDIIHLGNVQYLQDDLEGAQVTLLDGLAKIRKVGDLYWEAIALQTLGGVFAYADLNSGALEYLEQARDIFARIGAQEKVELIEEDIHLLSESAQPDACEGSPEPTVF